MRFVGLDGSDGEEAGRSSVFTVNEYHSGPTIRKLVCQATVSLAHKGWAVYR